MHSWDSISMIATSGMDISTLALGRQDAVTQHSKARSLKHNIDFDDSVSPQKRRILESYSVGDICQVILQSYSTGNIRQVAMNLQPRSINCCTTAFTSPAAKHLYREASDIFLKHKADAQLEPFSIKRIELYEPCNTTAFIWSLPAEILILIVTFLGAQDMRYVAQSLSLSAMIWPGTHSAVRINHLAIDSSDAAGSSSAPAGDALALSVVWIEAFPEVKHVSIIAAADVEVSVKLQSPERSS
ncbi:uncharacterized protein EDB91DRAFT_1253346 [Suillus paluster]|uniref:uncharacterized protein n=1 Tax=Suillus paluster TaxID=48578 RepID=UPI001B874001|nr:uncharacterized protein EDB91DRAFT_1253346 [Suillus paluster]KAG1728747.1 hypothetical protein EDB91DRAFT_1253346 [Suillus paluster]